MKYPGQYIFPSRQDQRPDRARGSVEASYVRVVQTLTDGNANVTTYAYDGHDRLSRTDFPATAPHGATWELLTYESLAGGARTSGLVASKRLRDGQTIGFQYDNVGRLKVKDLPGAEPDASYAYDLLGNMTSAVQGGQTLSFGHDALGRQVSETGPLGSTVSTLDIVGRRTQLVYPGTGLTIDQDHLVTGESTRSARMAPIRASACWRRSAMTTWGGASR